MRTHIGATEFPPVPATRSCGGFRRGVPVMILFLLWPAGPARAFFDVLQPLQPVSITVQGSLDKQQSHVWRQHGSWWSVLPNAQGTWLRRLDGDTWTDVLKISNATDTHADVVLLGDVVHVLLFREPADPSELISLEYDPLDHDYQPWSQRTTASLVTLDFGAETGTIDIDSTDRMWLASDAVNAIRVRYSDPPYDTWNGPVEVEYGVGYDDIGIVTSLPDSTIGVLWSNQAIRLFGFRTHVDGDPPGVWSDDEQPASQSAGNEGGGMADDHLNVAVASDGTLYAAVKTAFDTPGLPRVALLVRHPDGIWDALHPVDDGDTDQGTRGIVLLNELTDTVTVIYATAGSGDPSDLFIAYRNASTSSLDFGDGPRLLMEAPLDTPTSTKQNITDEAVILADTYPTPSEAYGVRVFIAAEALPALSPWGAGVASLLLLLGGGAFLARSSRARRSGAL